MAEYREEVVKLKCLCCPGGDHRQATVPITAPQAQQRCEAERKHLVRVPKHRWPPVKLDATGDKPHLAARCEHCGATLIVYDPPDVSITVRLLPGDARHGVVEDERPEGEGRVEDEPEPDEGEEDDEGRVLEEGDPDGTLRPRRRGRPPKRR